MPSFEIGFLPGTGGLTNAGFLTGGLVDFFSTDGAALFAGAAAALVATALPAAAQGKGELSIRGLARMVGRDVKRVHEDIVVLAELGLLERTETGGVVCPYTSMHIDMVLNAA